MLTMRKNMMSMTIQLQLRQLMNKPKVFPFYKHLIIQECRKDIVFQNDFTNTHTRERNTSFFANYKEKATKNKMRIAYILGFCALFSLDYVYDAFFQSSFYSTLVDRTERLFVKMQGEDYNKSVDFSNKSAIDLGKYFRQLQYRNIKRQITPSLIAGRVPAFGQLSNVQVFDVTSFVDFCQKHNISVQELPSPTSF